MFIRDFTFTATTASFTVTDGERVAHVVIEKNTGKVVSAEAVGASDVSSCFSFADEAAAWLSARTRPKRLGRSATAA